MLIIDCHPHIYAPDPKRYPTVAEPISPPIGVGTAEHLRAVTRSAGVTAVRAIQTASYHGYDNKYLCDAVAENADWMQGVVCLDPDDPSSENQLRRAAKTRGIRSLRSIPSPSSRSFDDDRVRRLWRIAADEGLTVDIFLMRAELIPSARKLLDAFPSMTVGFDHCMDLKPNERLSDDLRAMLELSSHPNLYPKIDFLHYNSEEAYPFADLHDAAMAIIREYGADRCVWGSSYPTEVWAPRSTYEESLRVFTEALPLTDGERALILGENARRLWFDDLL